MYVARVDRVAVGESIPFRTPAGARVLITRQGDEGTAEDFLALSSTCPHLGCQVHWEEANRRFFCPCHNGVFTPEGEGIDGPPKGMSLLRYPLKIEGGLLLLEAPVEHVARAGPDRPGDDGLRPA
jgi:Rieske Fe-S protein